MLTDLVVDDGAAIANDGGVVLGYWYVPFNEHRLRLCGEAYGRAVARHGAFTIFAVFRVNPYTLSSVTSEKLRNETVALLDGYGEQAARIICVLEASSLMAAAMRISAAATTRLIKRAHVLTFVSTVDEGLPSLAGVPGSISADTVRQHLVTLEREAARSAPPGTFPRIERPSWAAPL